ncbi:MAG TPA: dihydrodipicolinate synthase family protein [Candidatus Eremiobacteraceae bacterium]|jgi:4-hydroxy-2-oxoglutarate aldolase|nr:dihydrodipicolinate synthase family protein [Candidatus Eremiobacteraceae bacterium]
MDLGGVYPALTTPFAADGEVSLADVKYNIERYNSTGIAGFVVLGSTGESVLLSRNEMDDVLTTVRDAAGQGKRLIAGTGAESTQDTIERTKRAAELGYHFALVKTPHYYKPAYKPEVLIAHYRRVADASPIPVLLYSVPIFTGVTLEAPEVGALAEHPNIVGIKESSGHVMRVAEIVSACPADFQILTGSAGTMLAGLTVGAKGAILALGSALPEMCVTLYELYRNGEIDKARALQNTLLKASKVIQSEHAIAGIKFVMDQRGYHGGIPRSPLVPLSDLYRQRILDLLNSIEPALVRA